MRDVLERERQINNLVDRLARAEGEIERLKRLLADSATATAVGTFVPEMATSERWRLVVEETGDADGLAWLIMEEVG